jgi:hypothetical protein
MHRISYGLRFHLHLFQPARLNLPAAADLLATNQSKAAESSAFPSKSLSTVFPVFEANHDPSVTQQHANNFLLPCLQAKNPSITNDKLDSVMDKYRPEGPQPPKASPSAKKPVCWGPVAPPKCRDLHHFLFDIFRLGN